MLNKEIMGLLSNLRHCDGNIWIVGADLKVRAPKGALPENLKVCLRKNKADLIAFIQAEVSKMQATRVTNDVIPANASLTLSYAQQRTWFLEQLEGPNLADIQGGGLVFSGELNRPFLREALNTIVARHQSLLMSFPIDSGKPAVKIINHYDPITEYDFSGLDEAKKSQAIKSRVHGTLETPFVLADGPLFRADLLDIGKDKHILLVAMHHIICDGWSFGVLVKELMACYHAYLKNEQPKLPELSIRYSDYAAWQKKHLRGDILDRSLRYWTSNLVGAPALLELPTDKARPAKPSHSGGMLKATIDNCLTDRLRQLSHSQGATLFMTLLGVFTVLLARYSRQRDICVGTPIANRGQPQTEDLIGFFVNTLVMRNSIEEHSSFIEILARVKATAMSAYAHQDIPFEKLVDALKPERSLSYNPLFQAMFILQNTPAEPVQLENVQVSLLDDDNLRTARASNVDLCLDITEEDGRLVCRWEYALDLFRASTVTRITEHFEYLLRQFSLVPELSMSQAIALPSNEIRALASWNHTEQTYPKDLGLQHLIDRCAQQNPNATALIYSDDLGRHTVSYAELYRRTNRLAHYLIERCSVGPDTFVGICLERSIDMVVALIAVLKAGGAYIPLDPSYPRERLMYMIEDSGAGLLLTQASLADKLCDAQNERVNLTECVIDSDSFKRVLATMDGSRAPDLQGWTPANLAYVIYTSGSTGKPKGVMIEHRAAVNFVTGFLDSLPDCVDGPWLLLTTMTFDIALFEWMGSLSQGYSCVIASEEQQSDPEYLSRLISAEDIRLAQTTPSRWRQLLDSGWQGKDDLHVLCGGEALTADLETRLTPRCRTLFNCYGPTEATVWSLIKRVDPVSNASERLFLGGSLPNYQHYVLDEKQSLVPIGAIGELYIGGDSLARGYLHRAELTAERFIENPFSEVKKGRLYRTGDLVRWVGGGCLEYLGRTDDQLKIRGFRIELGEIEQAINTHEDVKKAVVVAQGEGGKKQLAAYLVLSNKKQECDSDTLGDVIRKHLKSYLPDYMIPRAVMVVDVFPYTPNGKIDKKALPKIDLEVVKANTYSAPTSSTEKLLCDIYSELLQLSKVGVNDSFFELGGNSLLVIRLVFMVRKKGIKIVAKDILTYPRIRDLGEHLDCLDGNGETLQDPSSQIYQSNNHGVFSLPNKYSLLSKHQVHHWNMSGIFEVHGVLFDELRESLTAIIKENEGLRHGFTRVAMGVVVENISTAPVEPVLEYVDLSNIAPASRSASLEARASRLQSSLILSENLYRFVYFYFGEDEPARFLYIVHHSIFDGYSFMIFMEELSGKIHQLRQGVVVKDHYQTTSIKDWGQYLYSYINSTHAVADFDYWTSLPWDKCGNLMDFPEGYKDNCSGNPSLYGLEVFALEKLSKKCSLDLIKNAQFSDGVGATDIILYALAKAMSRVSGSRFIEFDLLSSGREPIFREIDLSRTLGWCNYFVPIVVELEEFGALDFMIRRFIEQRQAIPNAGVGYEGLIYLSEDENVRRRIENLAQSNIMVNFIPPVANSLVGQDMSNDIRFAPAKESFGDRENTQNRVCLASYIEIGLVNEHLQLSWNYRDNVYKKETVDKVMMCWKEEVENAIQYFLEDSALTVWD